jgi:hypothetical protein
MAAISDAVTLQMQLVEQQLHENEAVDGLFEVSLERVVAITSERLMIMSGGGAKGWALTGIPWRLVTSVKFDPGQPDAVGTLEVKYTARSRRPVRTGEATETEATNDICPAAAVDARRMVHLMDARMAPAQDKR